MGTTRTRDIIAIGCSAGGVEMLPRLLHALPEDLAASITIVQHLASTPDPFLVSILERSTKLPVEWVEQGTKLSHARVFVAPPDAHVLYADGHLVLTAGPRENHARPSIDKLFRSAAALHGSRVIGVLLTGMLDDGVAGLRSIQAAGGVTLVQDPDEAPYPDLPGHAVLAGAADRVLPVLAIAQSLRSLVGKSVDQTEVPAAVEIEADLDRAIVGTPHRMSALGEQARVACPDCAGPTWEIGDHKTRRYRCYLGHVHTATYLLTQQEREVETALWSAVRALDERAATLETLAGDATRLGRARVAGVYAERARESREHADLARRFVLDVVKRASD